MARNYRLFPALLALLAGVAPALHAETWSRSYGDANVEEAHAVTETRDGGLVFAGRYEPTPAQPDLWVARLDLLGAVFGTRYEAGKDLLAVAPLGDEYRHHVLR